MGHDPTHAVYMIVGALYFAIATIFAFMIYQKTKHDGFWFFILLASFGLTIMLLSNFAEMIGIIPYGEVLKSLIFTVVPVLFFAATYTLTKKHHDERLF